MTLKLSYLSVEFYVTVTNMDSSEKGFFNKA